MTLNLDWLPDHHLGAVATLAHADELISEVGDLLFAYQSELDGGIGLREESDGRVNRAIVTSVAPIPRKLPLLVADALVSLRGVLEHTIFAEVEHRDGPLSEDVAKLVEMPARMTHQSFAGWKKTRARKGPPALSAKSDLLRAIELLQPFHRIQTPAEHPLARLVVYTNHAKHRTPAVAAVMLPAVYREDRLPRSFADVKKRPQGPLRVGEVVFEAPADETVPVSLHSTIGLNRPGAERWPILMQELSDIANWVRKQAVPRLINGGDLPADVLPARYDISVGHADERSAIVEGSQTSAYEHQLDRLLAWPARPEIVGLISMVPGAPAPELISRWAEQLPDKQVVERVQRFKALREMSPEENEVRVMQTLYDMVAEIREYLDQEQ